MKFLTQMIFIIIAFLANATFANSPLGKQIAESSFDNLLSRFFVIILLGAIISAGLSVMSKKPEFAVIGCGGISILALVIGLLTTLIQFVKAHSTAFIIAGIIIIFIILIICIIAYFDNNENKEPIETVIPKIAEPPHIRFSSKPATSQTSKEQKSFATAAATPAQATFNTSPHNPATSNGSLEENTLSEKEIAGKLGENAVCRAVSIACQEDKRYYKILQNVYIPKFSGKYSEIDVLLLHETGVYVFESKNLSGIIYGNSDNNPWERDKNNGEKEFIINPIKQNEGHINALCVFLKQNKYQFKSFNMVVFGTNAQLRHIPENTSFTSTHELYNLELDLIKKMKSQENFYSKETIDSWCAQLVPCMNIPEEEKQKHKERAYSKFNIS